ncbi:MAG: hypothetical protein J6U39_02750, partial [Clostridia bacterium]|nr:hypothetical protein [Clostridia bacterium]
MDKKEKIKELVGRIREIESIERFRREHDKLARYNRDKVHAKQMEFHKCGKRNRWVFGGNRSGKTECGAVEAVWWIRGIHPFRE